MRRLLPILLVGLLVVPRPIAAQSVSPGSRVRVTHPGEGTRIGTVVQLTSDTLEVHFEGRADAAHLPVQQVTRLYVSRGRQRHVLSRTGLGFLIGAGVGAAWGAAQKEDCSEICFGEGFAVAVGGVVLGTVGGVIGLIAGVQPSDTWERVALERSRIGIVAPTRSHGGGVGLSLAF